MALRIANKINRNIVKNISIRSLSTGKRDIELDPSVQKLDDVSRTQVDLSSPASPPPPPVPIPSASVKYEVCRPRTTPVPQFPNSVQNESDVVKKTVAMQHLQPSMLPEYYKPPIEINSACMGVDTHTENTSQYRKFEESNTFKSITLPLKAPKLANPFPEPVKVMPSNTVSDDEKAEQMLAESKIIKNVATTTGASVRPATMRAFPNSRSYSTQDGGTSGKKCKINQGKEARKCHKIKVPHCTPVKSIRCGKRKKRAVQCVKKMSPYPSYSESCHEDPYNKPSECKICPYKSEEHPTFKPPKNDYHTSTSPGHRERYNRLKISAKAGNKIRATPRSFLSTVTKRPPAKAKEVEKEAEKIRDSAKNRSTHQSSTVSLSKEMGAWLNRLQREDILLPRVSGMHETQVLNAKGKCKKFPFKECNFPLEKARKVQSTYKGKCPEKEKRKLIKDCPPENEDTCGKRTAPEAMPTLLTYRMSEGNEGSNDTPKKKCPKVNLGVCKNENDHRDDPCGRKRRGKTLICPNDLLKKGPRGKKKKKTSGVVPPLQRIPPATPKPETTVSM